MDLIIDPIVKNRVQVFWGVIFQKHFGSWASRHDKVADMFRKLLLRMRSSIPFA